MQGLIMWKNFASCYLYILPLNMIYPILAVSCLLMRYIIFLHADEVNLFCLMLFTSVACSQLCTQIIDQLHIRGVLIWEFWVIPIPIIFFCQNLPVLISIDLVYVKQCQLSYAMQLLLHHSAKLHITAFLHLENSELQSFYNYNAKSI